MLFETLDRIKLHAIMGSIVLIFMGWVLLVMPGNLIPFAGNVLAVVLVVYSLVKVFDFIASKKVLIDCIRLSIGLFGGVVGVMLFAFNDLFEFLLSILMIIVPVAFGIYGVYYSFVFARGSGRSGWWILLIVFSLLFCSGLFVFLNPWLDSAEGHLRVIGGTLIYVAAAMILSLIWIWPLRTEEA